jgi:RNA polymerase sigma factor (sigma-70 family)
MARPLPPTLARIIGEMSTAISGDVHTSHVLLSRFVATGDEEAFRGLIRFYGPLVWGVCHRCLRDTNDAEDALQATFIVLARKAARVSPPERLSVWLYGVAFRAAQKIREKAARRREIVGKTVPEQEVAPLPYPDLREVLDEELLRLPEDLRQAFVLCRVEGRTQLQAAQVLGYSPRTVGYRVTKATELLKVRLERRGLAPAGLVFPITGIIPASLVDRVAGGAFGKPSDTAAAVADTVIRSMASAGLWRYLALASLLIVGVGGIALCQGPSTPAMVASPSDRREAPAPPANPSAVLVWGQVLDPAGKPVPKARVALLNRPPASAVDPLPGDELVGNGEADREGRYRLEGVPLSRREIKLAAWAEGHAVAAVTVVIPIQKQTVEQDVHLSRPREIQGRLGDPQPGQGASSANGRACRVEVIQIGPLRKSLRPVAGWVGPIGQPQGEDLFWPKELDIEEGKPFVLRGMDPKQTIRVRMSGWLNSQILELVPPGPQPAPAGVDLQVTRRVLSGDGVKGLLTFSHPFETSWTGSRSVQVWKADTREILERARVWVRPATEDDQHPKLLGPFQAVAVEDGLPLPHGIPSSVNLCVCPPADSPYLSAQVAFGVPRKNGVPQARSGRLLVFLPRGVPVQGVVTEEGTGRVVAGATIQYQPRGRLADAYRGVLIGRDSLVRADAKGHFRIVVPPGPGYLLLDGPEEGYTSETIDLTRDSKTERCRAHKIVKIDLPVGIEKHDVKATLHRAEDGKGR